MDRTFTYLVPEGLDVRVGSLVRIPLASRRVRGVVVALDEAEPEGLSEIAGLVSPWPVAPAPMPEVLRWVAHRYVAPHGVVFDRVVPPRVRVTTEPHPERSLEPPLDLSRFPAGAELGEALTRGSGGLWVLQTSGHPDRAGLIAGLVGRARGQAVVCVPEVRWGAPVLRELQRVFGDMVRLDSASGDMERSRGWLEMAAGHHLGGGGRGAVFVPAPTLGLMVIDDETNPAYKDDRAPRFDARRVAIERCRRAGAACVLIDDAPSLEARWAVAEGRGRLVEPEPSLARSLRPNVELCARPDTGLSRELHRAVRDTLANGGRVGLLVPLAGYARALWCRSCERSVRCPRCESGVIFDKARAAARCGRCSYSARAPDVCPSCGSSDLAQLGAGSERLEEQIALVFPRAIVRRIDPAVLAEAQEAPDTSDADIYLTTWVGTKTSLRPSVTTVGVLDADTLIRRPDFRASESAFLVLAEMAAWAGPGGRLVVQTDEPSHHSVQAVVRADPGFFFDREIEFRRELSYPPFTELIRLRAAGERADELLEQAAKLAVEEGASVLGPMDVVVDGQPRREMLLKCPSAEAVALRLRDILPAAPRGSTLHVDVDPR